MHDISLEFEEGRLHGIVGPPGSGKTLLVHLLSLLDEPDFGTVSLFGEAVSPSPEEVRREIRNSVFGYVFPNPCLLPAFTVAENIAIPLFRISGSDEHSAHRRVAELLEFLEIEDIANERAESLGIDAQFLTALARALVHRPRLLFLPAPGRPGTLAPRVRRVVDELHITCLWAAGAQGDCAPGCDRVVRLDCGSVVDESLHAT